MSKKRTRSYKARKCQYRYQYYDTFGKERIGFQQECLANPRALVPAGRFDFYAKEIRRQEAYTSDGRGSKEEIDYIRGLYAGEACFVDHCFSAFYERIEELGLLDSSIVVVLRTMASSKGRR